MQYEYGCTLPGTFGTSTAACGCLLHRRWHQHSGREENEEAGSTTDPLPHRLTAPLQTCAFARYEYTPTLTLAYRPTTHDFNSSPTDSNIHSALLSHGFQIPMQFAFIYSLTTLPLRLFNYDFSTEANTMECQQSVSLHELTDMRQVHIANSPGTHSVCLHSSRTDNTCCGVILIVRWG